MVRAQVTRPLILKYGLLFTSLLLATLLTGASLTGLSGRTHPSLIMVASYAAGGALLIVGL